jgi:hypothetical protein
MISPWIWEGHCPLVINIYKTRMPSDTLLTEEKKKAEYIGRQLRISLFAATGTPTQPSPSCQKWERFSLSGSSCSRCFSSRWTDWTLAAYHFQLSQFSVTLYRLCILLCLWEELLQLCTTFHIVQSSHYEWFTNRCSTNRITVSLLCISLLISSYMFRLNCHHQGAGSILLKITSIK